MGSCPGALGIGDSFENFCSLWVEFIILSPALVLVLAHGSLYPLSLLTLSTLRFPEWACPRTVYLLILCPLIVS